jgi:beta-glucosidase
VNPCIGHISGNSTLGIPSICMGDGPPGVSNSLTNVTTFPAPVLASSTWNSTVQYVFGQALAREHMGKGRNVVLAPTINILRSSLWGRAAETFSEDPWLTARFAVAGIQGIQSQGALACPKHFAAYNQETNRFGPLPDYTAVDAIVDERTLHEVYLPAFKASVQEADAAAVMCSYNRVKGYYACENDYLLNKTLRQDWGFEGFVVADWYFSTRSTVASIMAGLDINMPGGDLTDSYGFPDFFGEPFAESLANNTIPHSRLDDMVERIWRYMFKLGVIDHPVNGSALVDVRTQEHLDLAQSMVEDGAVLLKNYGETLPLSSAKYSKIAVFGVGATTQNQVSENHGGFVKDSTMIVQAPLAALKRRGAAEGIEVRYAEAYPGNGVFPTILPSMFLNSGLNVSYYRTLDFSGPPAVTDFVPNITAATYPPELWEAYPDAFTAVYEGVFLPNTTGTYHFSLVGTGTSLLYLDDVLVGNQSYHNFGGDYVQGIAFLTEGSQVRLRLEYSMAYSLSTGAYGVTLGVSPGNLTREHSEADALAEWADLSIIFASDRLSEGCDSGSGLSLPGDQDAVIERVAANTDGKTVVVLNTNAAILMPWIDAVDAVMEIWYPGQQVGLALERLLFGDVSPSGHLPVTFPKNLEDAVRINTDVEAVFEEGLYVGYKAFDANGVEPLFPFGHGLTYSEFHIDGQSVAVVAQQSGNGITESVRVSATLENIGKVTARQVVQLYVAYPKEAMEPPKLLRAFQKYELEAGESTAVELTVAIEDLKVWDRKTKTWKLIGGEYSFMLGFSSRDICVEKTIVL